jgi:avermectin B 5-O-methyltransferase
VTGVTVSRWQVEEGNRRVAETGLTGRVVLQYADATDLPFPDGSFDAAIALESLVHMSDKRAALDEARRVLRPGGRLAVADLVRNALMTEQQAAAWSAMPVAAALSRDEYARLIADSGFAVEENLDCTRQVARSFQAVRDAVHRGGDHLVQVYGRRALRQAREGVVTMMTVSEACLGYTVITARRS